MMGVRGPYGNSFDIRAGRLLLVGGGTGLVPLMRLIYRAPPDAEITLAMGARTRPEVLFADVARTLLGPRPHSIVVCTDDGSYGRQGLVTDAAADALVGGDFDAVYTCGPEPMMHKTMRLAHDAGVFAQASVERIMKCGAGLCGSCCMGHELVCRDGTVFEAGRLLANPDFGVRYRTKSGEIAHY
jgi:dihydroorotate dehydrogenase electron transfer subunit